MSSREVRPLARSRAVSLAVAACLLLVVSSASHWAAAAESEPLPAPLSKPAATPMETADAPALAALEIALLNDPAALLRAAQAAVQASDWAAAEQSFDALARRHSIVGDYAALLRARALRKAGRPADAEAHVERALSDFPTSPLRAELHALQGDLRLDQGDESGARSAWALAYSECEAPEIRAALLAAVAESQDRAGDTKASRASWQRVWSRHPASPEALRAAKRLDELEALPGAVKRTAEDWRQRADRLFSEMHNESALEAYDRALADGLSGTLRTTTLMQRAHTLFRLRRYPEALKAFESLSQKGDIPIWRGRSLARADRVPEAITLFESLARKAGPNQADARFFAASLLEGRGREQEARVHLMWLADDPRQGELSRTALWKLGWSDYRHGRFGDAVERFESLVASTSDPIGRLKPVYWRARALAGAGRGDESTAEFDALARDFPLSYYGWRARPMAATSFAAVGEQELRAGQSRLTPSALARVRILIDAGLHDYGAAETGRLVRRAGGLEDRLALARLLTTAADYHTAQQLVVDAYELPLARGPIPGQEELWRMAWPYAFSDYVESATRTAGSVQPTLVYAIMREESGFRPRVISPVGARGLLQIMRETGARLAARVGRASFDPDELFDPQTNIELGSSYLGELGQLFPKRLSASIASYNAGPHVVRDWAPGGDRPDDEWVETIPYAETQGYVKRVLRSVEAYRLIYGRGRTDQAAAARTGDTTSTPISKSGD